MGWGSTRKNVLNPLLKETSFEVKFISYISAEFLKNLDTKISRFFANIFKISIFLKKLEGILSRCAFCSIKAKQTFVLLVGAVAVYFLPENTVIYFKKT